eukprot:scaffold229321_cov27-Tisochrysis_lutea.AAC.3
MGACVSGKARAVGEAPCALSVYCGGGLAAHVSATARSVISTRIIVRSSSHTQRAHAIHLSLRRRKIGCKRMRCAPWGPRCTSSSSTAGRPRLRDCSSVSISRSGSRIQRTRPCDQTCSDIASRSASKISTEPKEAASVSGVSPRRLRMLAPPCSSRARRSNTSPWSTQTCIGVLPCAVKARWRRRFFADSSAWSAASVTSACCLGVSCFRWRSADALTCFQWPMSRASLLRRTCHSGVAVWVAATGREAVRSRQAGLALSELLASAAHSPVDKPASSVLLVRDGRVPK